MFFLAMVSLGHDILETLNQVLFEKMFEQLPKAESQNIWLSIIHSTSSPILLSDIQILSALPNTH